MTTKYPQDVDEPICEWCDGSGEFGEFPCDRCNGTGWARFDPSNVNARTQERAVTRILPPPATEVHLYCHACGYRWNVAEFQTGTWWGKKINADKIAPMCWCPKCSATPPIVVEGR